MGSDSFFLFMLSGAVLFISSIVAVRASRNDHTAWLTLAGVLFAGSLLTTMATVKGVIDYVYFHKGAGLLTIVLVFGISFFGFVLAKALDVRLMKAPALIFAIIGFGIADFDPLVDRGSVLTASTMPNLNCGLPVYLGKLL